MKSLRVVCTSLLIANLTAYAQTYIFGKADFPVGANANGIAISDFNGDGITDVAVLNGSDDTVSILLGKPDGTFAPQVTYPTDKGPLAIAVGDFNGDGVPDLAITNGDCVAPSGIGAPICDLRTVSIFLGNGDGTFGSRVDYATGTQPSSVAVGDFNGDGKLDLAIANTQDNTVSVLLGNGDGTFQSQVTYPTVASPQSVIVADFNGDQKLDLAVGGEGSGVSVLLGNGDGTFQKALESPGGAPLAAADFNLDGKLDLFAGGDVLLGNGDGTFVLHASYPNGVAVAAADLNGDGKPDLVIAQGGVATNDFSYVSVAVLLGNGDGTFQAGVQYGSGVNPSSVVIADFNGDGKLDIGSCSLLGAFSVLLGFGDGTFVAGTDYSFPGAGNLIQPVTADFNGDGKPDIAANSPFELAVFLGKGDGTFQPAVSTSLTQSTGGMVAADFNGDGKADLALTVSNCSGSTCLPGDVLVLIGNGDGTFQAPVEYPVGVQPEYLAVGDFNGDGKPDLAVSNLASGTVSILLNAGDGTFQPHVDYPAGADASEIVTGDFMGNGILDLAVLNPNPGTISILLGKGDGTFTASSPVTILGEFIAAADLNGDGKTDLAVTSEQTGGGQVLILLSKGDGTFQAPVSYPDGEEYGIPTVADINGDGKPDLIFDAWLYGYISSILLGNGDGSFQPPIFTFLSSASPIAAADFSNDGSLDLAAGIGTQSGEFITVILSTAFKAVSPSSPNFGSQGVGTTSSASTITISNPSNVSFDIASIVAAGNFSQTNDCVGTLSIGGHCSVDVTFTPTATGAESGAITVTDSTRISPLAIPLSGIGVNGPFLTAYPSRTVFPPQVVGSSGSASMVALANTGNAPLNISGISISGANASDFTQTNSCSGSLPAGGSCTVKVSFTPTATGSRLANIAVADTAPGSPQTAALFGVGLAPPDFNVALAAGGSSSQTINAGQSAKFDLLIAPSGSFTGTVQLTCAVSPLVSQGPACTLSNTTLQVSNGSAMPVTVTIGTTMPSGANAVRYIDFLPVMPLLVYMSLGVMALRVRARKRLLAPVAPIILGLALCLSCGGSSSSNNTVNTQGTPPGTYTATVTATSGNLKHNMTLQVMVQE